MNEWSWRVEIKSAAREGRRGLPCEAERAGSTVTLGGGISMQDTWACATWNREVVKLDTNAAVSLPRLLAVFLTTAKLSDVFSSSTYHCKTVFSSSTFSPPLPLLILASPSPPFTSSPLPSSYFFVSVLFSISCRPFVFHAVYHAARTHMVCTLSPSLPFSLSFVWQFHSYIFFSPSLSHVIIFFIRDYFSVWIHYGYFSLPDKQWCVFAFTNHHTDVMQERTGVEK